jgi:predicted glycogen debranching enzyme
MRRAIVRRDPMNDLRYGRERLGDPEVASRLEWLVTNGIGGFASGTLSGALTRRYHGLLFAALKPPLGRTLLLAKLAERLELDGAWLDLDTNRWASGAIHPQGCLRLESFHLEETIPTWTWAIGDTRLEKRIWMEQGENTTYVQYRLSAARGPVRLALRALVNHRDSHELTAHGAWDARVEPATGGLRVEAYEGATPLWLLAPGAEIRPEREWYRGFALPVETERGLDDVEDHLYAGEITVRLAPGDYFTVIASTRRDAGTGEAAPLAVASALARRRSHERSLIEAWKGAQPGLSRHAPPWVRQLVLAADAFLVERSTPTDLNGRSVIAGYPWFSDWGRDTMIALPGLTLATGRPEVARAILGTFARHVDQGMLPNFFPDQGEAPEYNTVDAALWFFHAVREYHDATEDDAFLREVYPVLEDIGAWYERGTRYGIMVDPEDGLVRAGENGVALTWMDARVEDWVVTPRIGKPVEINALWYSALKTMARFARRLKRAPESYDALALRVERGFARFWNPAAGCLFDLLDGPDGHDAAIRPNQIFALSLPESPLPPAQRRAVLEVCGRLLLTSHGLRSLAPTDPAYRPIFTGDRRQRDGAYHQGTVWTWLLPHYALAYERVTGNRETALAFLDPFADLLGAFGVGSLPEVADGDLPHAPRGCIAQAWTVAEALRAWHSLATERRRSRRSVRSRMVEVIGEV